MAYGTVNTDIVSDSSGGRLAPISSVFRNRIINGAMVIDQRNAGASVTPTSTSSNNYVVDRWAFQMSQASKFSAQQNAGSVTPPVGFTKYLGVTSLAATSLAAGDYYLLVQPIEGFNTADLGWGTANAKTVTLSFQVYSSLTGTFGGALQNNAANRSYPFTYSIPVANTWTTISVTITGDTTGTWLTTNGTGLNVYFGLGVGTTYSGTAGSWSGTAGGYNSVTGATSVVGTNGATFYITGVQLEVGSSATGFEYRQYQQELALCQRYYETTSFPSSTFNQSATRTSVISSANNNVGGNNCNFVVPKRAAPTVTLFSRNNTSGQVSLVSSGGDFAGSATANQINSMGFSNILLANNATSGALIEAGYTASAEL